MWSVSSSRTATTILYDPFASARGGIVTVIGPVVDSFGCTAMSANDFATVRLRPSLSKIDTYTCSLVRDERDEPAVDRFAEGQRDRHRRLLHRRAERRTERADDLHVCRGARIAV